MVNHPSLWFQQPSIATVSVSFFRSFMPVNSARQESWNDFVTKMTLLPRIYADADVHASGVWIRELIDRNKNRNRQGFPTRSRFLWILVIPPSSTASTNFSKVCNDAELCCWSWRSFGITAFDDHGLNTLFNVSIKVSGLSMILFSAMNLTMRWRLLDSLS